MSGKGIFSAEPFSACVVSSSGKRRAIGDDVSFKKRKLQEDVSDEETIRCSLCDSECFGPYEGIPNWFGFGRGPKWCFKCTSHKFPSILTRECDDSYYLNVEHVPGMAPMFPADEPCVNRSKLHSASSVSSSSSSSSSGSSGSGSAGSISGGSAGSGSSSSSSSSN